MFDYLARTIKKQILNTEVPVEAGRTITYVGDAVDALIGILERPEHAQNQIFNVGNPQGEITIRDLAHLMREVPPEITGAA